MLIPITREKFEQLVPSIATGSQYAAVWGTVRDVLRRLLISFVGVIVLFVLDVLFGGVAQGFKFILGIVFGFYWLWSPVYWASIKNASYRKWRYSGFWRGRVLDTFITEDIIDEAESFNRLGDLVIVENRERRINVEIGDKEGFRTIIKAPLQRIHKAIARGQPVECLVMSNDPDLESIREVSDVYIPSQDLWVGAYPCLRRDFFLAMREDLRDRYGKKSSRTTTSPSSQKNRPPRRPSPPRRSSEESRRGDRDYAELRRRRQREDRRRERATSRKSEDD
ncbi:phosphate ABC transporter permease [Spirulina sp. 06S082]|uniref:phosphate ABC transporter permease n=1 Tax=Spirulina sp. 06S082 TaxID=3110248 RepID=UPI002B1F7F85|nr:phosphate ABC transporter permease [Spirulina sp. 06S082]MEA5472205.1 phosphate ABC transporter permease [Spirulina sp. 06S082]